jgi:hypothetical protein
MKSPHGLEQCLSFIHCNLQPGTAPPPDERTRVRFRAVTISRQTGAGAHEVADRLGPLLARHSLTPAGPWQIYDRELVEQVLVEHHLPGRLAKFMPEDGVSAMTDTMDELFGLHPPTWTLVSKTEATIRRLVERGNVVIIGRAASAITSELPYVFHLRLVRGFAQRVQYIRERQHLSETEARDFVRREDAARARYLRRYFDREIEDPLLYHVVLNTDRLSFDEAAELIVHWMSLRGIGGPAA